ncbi:MAG: SDR family NAD(P)-dependent oxidoreductase [Elusimicrobiota bacterium]
MNSIMAAPRRGLPMYRSRFQGQAVIVTGAGSGIGLACADAFAGEGASVVLAGRSASVERAAGDFVEQNLDVTPFVGDMTSQEQAERLIRHCLERFNRLDVLVNAAGVCRGGAVDQISLEEWNYVVSGNLTSTYLCTRYAVSAMKRLGGGSIVNVSSLAGRFRGGVGGAHYAASKAAVIGFTRHAAAELAPFKIRINAVCPGPTATAMLDAGLEAMGMEATEVCRRVPMGYISTPQEQARVILFAASSDASYITGAAIDVNGGIFG